MAPVAHILRSMPTNARWLISLLKLSSSLTPSEPAAAAAAAITYVFTYSLPQLLCYSDPPPHPMVLKTCIIGMHAHPSLMCSGCCWAMTAPPPHTHTPCPSTKALGSRTKNNLRTTSSSGSHTCMCSAQPLPCCCWACKLHPPPLPGTPVVPRCQVQASQLLAREPGPAAGKLQVASCWQESLVQLLVSCKLPAAGKRAWSSCWQELAREPVASCWQESLVQPERAVPVWLVALPCCTACTCLAQGDYNMVLVALAVL
jgi:hypothetical protein